MKKNYWFYIDSYVHIAVKNKNVLFYNPYNGKLIEYHDNPKVSKLTSLIQSKKNLRVIPLNEEQLSDSETYRFVEKIREHFMGDLLDAAYSEGKPIQMPPIVRIHKDKNFKKKIPGGTVGESLKNYISEVSFHITDSCCQSCPNCGDASRHFFCCYSGKSTLQQLDISKIFKLMDELKGVPSVHINITGGDIWQYYRLDSLVEYLRNYPYSKTFLIHYLNLAEARTRVEELSFDNADFKVPVSFPVEEEKFKIAIETLDRTNRDTTLLYIVESIEDLQKAEALLEKYPAQNPEVRAFYNGSNLPFFRDLMFINRERISKARPSLKDIYINGSINPLFFGKLTVLTNGEIHSGLFQPPLGILGKDSIYDISMKEMKSGKSWRKLRSNVSPCRSCIFENLCPPVSDYNHAIGKYDLCNMGMG